MSSFATAPSRTADKDPQSGTQLHLLSNPDTTPEQGRLESAAANSQTVDEVNRVERLLSQLEARSLALVPYGYGSLRPVPAPRTNTALIAGTLVAIWLGSVILAVTYIRYGAHSPSAIDRAAVTAPVVLAPESDPQEQKVASSVDHLAKALVSSSDRMNELQAAMERNNRDLQRIAAKVNTDHPKSTTLAVPMGGAMEDAAPPTVSAATPNLPKNWHRVLEIKPTDAAVPHKGADGKIDYWLVQRGIDPAPSKVLPIGTSADGVVIHNLEDGKDYTLTPMGEWRNGAIAPGGN